MYKFLIYISYAYAIPIGRPLEYEIKKRGYEIKWFSELETAKRKLIQEELDVLNDIRDVLAYRPDIVLAAANDVPDFINALKVQIFHGFHAEKRKGEIGHFRIRGFFDLYCTQGPSTTSEFKDLQKKHRHFEVIETGWPKVDPLFPINKKSNRKVPTIMIASTFTPRLSLAYNEEVFQAIRKISETGKFRIFMVLHPKMPEAIVAKWKSLNNKHFTFFDTTDLIPLFKQADFMFADTTSAIQEFLLQRKPVVTFRHSQKKDYLIQIEEASQIDASFEKALHCPEEIMNSIEKYILQLHPYFDGRSSERLISAVIEFLHKDKSYLKRKPLNLARKYRIRKQLHYFTWKSYNRPFRK
ncbi:MAG: UDP-N-acetylglucosamine 2-epimerase [Flavobacteriaceae bacterium]|nr:UDP-N-acetylglucosamine 2-epimerase [Flavobacteriaceae bacterium]